MKAGWWLLAIGAVVFLGGLLGELMIRDPGYILVAYGDMAAETSLWFGVIALLGLYILIRFAVFAITRLLTSAGALKGWFGKRQSRTAHLQTNHGLLLMTEGQWSDAERYLANAANGLDVPLVNYLGAARAAHHRGQDAARDDYLKRAEECTPGSGLAVGLVRAELLQETGDWEASIAQLRELRERKPRHPKVLRLLSRAMTEVGDYQGLIELVGDLRKAKALSDKDLGELERAAWRDWVAAAPDVIAADERYRQRAKSLQGDASVLLALCGDRYRQDPQLCERHMREFLQKHWHDDIIELYGRLDHGDVEARLSLLESRLKKHPNSAPLLLALGRLSVAAGQTERARDYFESSLRLHKSSAASLELGRLMIAEGDTARGSEHVNQGLLAEDFAPANTTDAPEASAG